MKQQNMYIYFLKFSPKDFLFKLYWCLLYCEFKYRKNLETY